MLRLFSLFGRSAALAALDDALRGAGVHPLLVPEAVKLTLLRLHRGDGPAGETQAGLADSAALLAYCLLGRAAFVESNGAAAADHADARLEAATEADGSRDAQIVLLALHAGLVAPEIADRLEIAER